MSTEGDSHESASDHIDAGMTSQPAGLLRRVADQSDDIVQDSTSTDTLNGGSLDSNNISLCRICQLTEQESGKPLEETGCKCKGTIQMCHRECIKHWIVARRSSICELCQSPMQYDVIYQVSQRDNDTQYTNLSRAGFVSSCVGQGSRRAWFMIVFSILFLATWTGVATTSYTQMQLSWLRSRTIELETTVSPVMTREYDYLYGLSLAITIFCATIASAFGCVWLIWELIVLPRERFLIGELREWIHNLRSSAGTSPVQEVMRVNSDTHSHRTYSDQDGESAIETTSL